MHYFYSEKYGLVKPINDCIRLIPNLSINTKLKIFNLWRRRKKVQSLPKGFEIVSSVCQYVCIMYVPALCTHRYEYSSKAFECYHYCQKHSKIPNFNFESNIENIFTIPQQSEANSFGWSMASNNWKACVSNILNHQKSSHSLYFANLSLKISKT